MNWKKLTRSALALVLVCCLVFNIVAIPTQASALLQTLWIMGENAMLGIIKSLGVEAGNETSDLLGIAAEAWAAYKSSHSWVDATSDRISGFITDPAKSIFMLPMEMVLWTRSWLFDSGVVYSGGPTELSVSCEFDGVSYEVTGSVPFVLIAFRDTTFDDDTYCWYSLRAIASQPGYIKFNGQTKNLTAAISKVTGNVFYNYQVAKTSSKYLLGAFSNASVPIYDYWVSEYSGTFPLVSGRDIIIESLVSPTVGFSTGYADWAASAQTLTDATGQEQEYIQLGVGQTVAETLGKTQTELQSGVVDRKSVV